MNQLKSFLWLSKPPRHTEQCEDEMTTLTMPPHQILGNSNLSETVAHAIR